MRPPQLVLFCITVCAVSVSFEAPMPVAIPVIDSRDQVLGGATKQDGDSSRLVVKPTWDIRSFLNPEDLGKFYSSQADQQPRDTTAASSTSANTNLDENDKSDAFFPYPSAENSNTGTTRQQQQQQNTDNSGTHDEGDHDLKSQSNLKNSEFETPPALKPPKKFQSDDSDFDTAVEDAFYPPAGDGNSKHDIFDDSIKIGSRGSKRQENRAATIPYREDADDNDYDLDLNDDVKDAIADRDEQEKEENEKLTPCRMEYAATDKDLFVYIYNFIAGNRCGFSVLIENGAEYQCCKEIAKHYIDNGIKSNSIFPEILADIFNKRLDAINKSRRFLLRDAKSLASKYAPSFSPQGSLIISFPVIKPAGIPSVASKKTALGSSFKNRNENQGIVKSTKLMPTAEEPSSKEIKEGFKLTSRSLSSATIENPVRLQSADLAKDILTMPDKKPISEELENKNSGNISQPKEKDSQVSIKPKEQLQNQNFDANEMSPFQNNTSNEEKKANASEFIPIYNLIYGKYNQNKEKPVANDAKIIKSDISSQKTTTDNVNANFQSENSESDNLNNNPASNTEGKLDLNVESTLQLERRDAEKKKSSGLSD